MAFGSSFHGVRIIDHILSLFNSLFNTLSHTFEIITIFFIIFNSTEYSKQIMTIIIPNKSKGGFIIGCIPYQNYYIIRNYSPCNKINGETSNK